MKPSRNRAAFDLGSLEVPAGRSATGELPIAKLVTGTQISLPVQVLHGRSEGPVVWLSAAVHGDEIAGVEIIRRVVASLTPKTMSGTVIAVPIVNAHGFLAGDRYLPDRRDLNRSFPGSATGSLAARVANLFMTEIVRRCDIGIDLHTGSDHRTNYPQVRADLDDAETRRLAEAFGAPLMLHAKVRDGSLRGAATALGKTVLLYEGGEAWRFDREAIEIGELGVRQVLAELGVTAAVDTAAVDTAAVDTAAVDTGATDSAAVDRPATRHPRESRRSSWVRARRSGIALLGVGIGDSVTKGQVIGDIHDSVGVRLSRITASHDGLIIGQIQHPLVNQGDAIVHIAQLEPS